MLDDLDTRVRQLIAGRAAEDSVFASLDPALTAPHEPTLAALHAQYAAQQVLLASPARVAAWLPKTGAGSTYAAALCVAHALAAGGRVLVVTSDIYVCGDIELALRALGCHGDRVADKCLDVYETFEAVLSDWCPPLVAYTHVIVDLGHAKTVSVEFFAALEVLAGATGIVRFVGAPSACARSLVHVFVGQQQRVAIV